jgi:hypothetical protein
MGKYEPFRPLKVALITLPCGCILIEDESYPCPDGE